MEKTTAKAEVVFARAIELPAGRARDELVAALAANEPALHREVESLLAAHEAAGDFLRSRALPSRAAATRHQGAIVVQAAAQAEDFLRRTVERDSSQVEAYVAALPEEVPEEVRKETRERIQAGLRARQLRIPTALQPPPGEEPIPQLPGFHIDRKLGEGGLGVVYSAHDQKLDRRVAIKVLRRGSEEAVRRRALDEARKAAALRDPAVVTVFSVLDECDPPAIIMEWVEGFPLDRFAAQLNFEQKARLLREVARGLASAHASGLVHRDLKPENVIVGPEMRPRILDFGLALSLDEAGRLGRGFEGTPLYASPEQVLGRSLSVASDVFSFGSLMFKVLTGRAPFEGETIGQVFEAIATTAPPFLREVAVGVPEDLQAICLACLAWNPADRPAASEITVELGHFLVGEPVRLKPKLYDDLLRRSISEYSSQARAWESQSIISREERDSMEVVHRRLLADEDHWLIDARRITLLQTVLSGGAWLAVVATVLSVWMLREDLGPQWRWILPSCFTLTLLLAGRAARRKKENLGAATFLAGATLASAPCMLAVLGRIGVFGAPQEGVAQLFEGSFTNQQVLASSLTALVLSVFGWRKLKMTGFAWTTATLATTSYLSFALLYNWLEHEPEIQALWLMPLAAMEVAALVLERKGRVRWTMPFHLIALVVLVCGLDTIALKGSTLEMLGVTSSLGPYFEHERLIALSVLLNGLLFLGLMLATERSASLDLRRASKLLEILAILHTLTPLFINALDHRGDAYVRVDVAFYVGSALLLTILAPMRSRWRMLVGGLAGCGLASYLLVELGLVARKPFIISLGFFGLLMALGTLAYAWRGKR